MDDKETSFAPLNFQGSDPREPTLQLNEDGEVDEIEHLPDEQEVIEADDDWLENLAGEGFPEDKRSSLAGDIIELVEYDKTVRDPWRKLMVRGLEMMGLKKGDIDDGPFPGAATVVHPIMTEAIIQFWARALPEIFPSDGPVKGKVLGKQDEERNESAMRVEEHMNYQCLFEDKGYRRETSRMVFLLGAYGSAFKKSFRNTTKDRTEGVCVDFEDFIVPYTATSLDTAPRYTHRMRKTHNEVKKKQKGGEWYDCDLSTPIDEETDDEQAAKDDVSRVTPSGSEKDARHEIYECYIELDLEDLDSESDKDGIELPYIVTLDKESSKVLCIRRNWKQTDDMREKQSYFTSYEFLPGFGFYGLGLFHIIGTLSEASTGALRAILDGSATASLQGGFITRDLAGKLGVDGDDLVVEPGVYKVIDAMSEELNKGIYTPDFKPPSPVLMEVLGFLVDSGRRLASTTETLTGEGDNTGPVGTTVALIEQGMKVFSTVHQSMHMSMAHELRIRFDLNRDYAPEDGYQYDVHGDEKFVYTEDYGPQTDVVPVSDPNIFSTTQRLAIAQATYQLATDNPDIYDTLAVHRRVHEAMKTPDYEELLIDHDNMIPLDPVAENQCLLTSQPIRVFGHQDHQSHITVHLAMMQNPATGAHPEVFPVIEAASRAHIAEHLAALHAQQVTQMGLPVNTINFGAQRPEEIAPEENPEIGAMAAQMAQQLVQAPGLPVEEQEQEAPTGQSPEELQAIQEMKMRHKDEEHQMAMQHKAQAFQIEQQAKQQAAMAESQRKDGLAVAEAKRKEQAAALELERKGQGASQDIKAKAEEVMVKKAGIDTVAEAERERADEALVAEQARLDTAHDAEMERDREAAALELSQARVKGDEEARHQSIHHQHDRQEKGADKAQERKEKVKDSEQARDQRDADEKRKAAAAKAKPKTAAKPKNAKPR